MQNGEDDELLGQVQLPEDRQLILDVLGAIRACRQPHQLCTSWVLNIVGDGFVLNAYLPRPTQQQQTVEVTHDDLSLIESVNIMRVRVGVASFAQGQWGLKIHITGHHAPLSFCMYDPVRIRAKRTVLREGDTHWSWLSGLVKTVGSSKNNKRPVSDSVDTS